MLIDFFEEYPDKINLRKAELIDFDSTIYLAARSFREFREAEKLLKEANPKLRAAFWPVLESSYWISPFARPSELAALFEALLAEGRGGRLEILLDLELPLLRKSLLLMEFVHFLKNKTAIKNFLSDCGKQNTGVTTAEYPGLCRAMRLFYQFAGLSWPAGVSPHKRIILFYSSMVKREWQDKLFRRYLSEEARRTGRAIQVGLGTIARGAFGDEPVLSPAGLGRDLSFLKENGIERAVIFRLGGLNKDYLDTVTRYL
ncbi:MAG TPA: hypothetical protein PKI19_02735 [Elusimicrobiales bacterium]|nr:hypothetical protein [Elusimicrobiales bacterium]